MVFFCSNFRDMEKVMPVFFGQMKMSFWVGEFFGKATAMTAARKFG